MAPDFGSREFWEANALAPKAEYVEWFAGYSELVSVLRSACSPAATVLHAGCGISSLSQALYDDLGVRHQIAVDFSEQCIIRQHALCQGRAEIGNAVMDCTCFGLRPSSVDVCIDKGTLDALLCIDEGSDEAVAAMAADVMRVVRPDGLWVLISFNSPSTVVPTVEEAAASGGRHALVACHALHSGNGALYVYTCKLSLAEPTDASAGADARSRPDLNLTSPQNLPIAHPLTLDPHPDADPDPEPALTLPLTSAHRGWLRAVHGHAAALLETSARDCRAWDQEGLGAYTGEGGAGGVGSAYLEGTNTGSGTGGTVQDEAEAEILSLLLGLRLLPDAAPQGAPQPATLAPSPPSPRSLPLPPLLLLGSPVHLRSLVVLQLQGLCLSVLPCSDALLRGLGGLRTLDCRRNRLCALPAALGALGALETLLLDRNSLETLPIEIGELAALRTLSITHNRLTALWPSWHQLVALRTLRLQGNPLGAPQLVQLAQCTRLRLSGGGSNITSAEGVSMPPPGGVAAALCITSIDELQARMLHEANVSVREAQVVGPDARTTAISWTGGKDCNLALLDAWRNPLLHVTSLVVFRPEGAVFRAHPLKLAEAQSASLELPLIHVIIPKGTTDYKQAYVDGMRNLRAEHGIDVIATGDMDLVGSMTRNWIEECGEEAGIEAYLPLWQAPRAACLRRLIAEGFEVVFSCVKSPFFDRDWVGQRLDVAMLEAIEAMAAAAPPSAGVKPLDIGGENGEYHTMVLGGPLYARAVPLEACEPLELEGQPGQPAGERWWTIGVSGVG